jgi:hypothetical protein
MGSHFVAEAGLKFMCSSDASGSASQIAETAGVNHCAWLNIIFILFIYNIFKGITTWWEFQLMSWPYKICINKMSD